MRGISKLKGGIVNIRLFFVSITMLLLAPVKAQLYDGIAPKGKYRLFLPVIASLENGKDILTAPCISYRYDPTDWLTVTPALQYYSAIEDISPQLWLNVNWGRKYFLLSKSMYDIRSRHFRETLSATVILPWECRIKREAMRFMIDATWENLYNGRAFIDGDRLQAVGGFDVWRFVCNAGYSMRAYPGVIANLRFKITRLNFLQLKYDGGLNTLTVSAVLQVNSFKTGM